MERGILPPVGSDHGSLAFTLKEHPLVNHIWLPKPTPAYQMSDLQFQMKVL